MESDTAESTSSAFTWTWGNRKLGTLATVIHADGTIRQQRHHPRDAAASDNPWGRISPEVARHLIQQARATVDESVTPTRDQSPFPPVIESVEVRVTSTTGDFGRRVPVAELSRHPELLELRKSVVALRRKISGGFFSWRSIGGRLAILLACVIGLMTWWIVRDWRETSQMEQSAERLNATVLTREGANGYDQKKFITVKFTPHSGKTTETRIEQFLSAENWDKSLPGETVRVWHDATTGHTYLENDIQRWNRDKKWIPLLPIGIAIPIIVICLGLSQYRVGVHDDGREYLVVNDYVAGDDRDALIDRTTYNAGRLLWWLAK